MQIRQHPLRLGNICDREKVLCRNSVGLQALGYVHCHYCTLKVLVDCINVFHLQPTDSLHQLCVARILFVSLFYFFVFDFFFLLLIQIIHMSSHPRTSLPQCSSFLPQHPRDRYQHQSKKPQQRRGLAIAQVDEKLVSKQGETAADYISCEIDSGQSGCGIYFVGVFYAHESHEDNRVDGPAVKARCDDGNDPLHNHVQLKITHFRMGVLEGRRSRTEDDKPMFATRGEERKILT